MDLTLTPDEVAFRDEVRAWLTANVPAEPLPSMDTEVGFAAHMAWERRLAAAGLSAVSWPRALGGRDATLIEWLNPTYRQPPESEDRKVRVACVQYSMRKIQGFDEFAAQPHRQRCAQLSHGAAGRTPEATEPPADGTAQQRQPVAPAPAARRRDAGQRIPRRPSLAQRQAAAVAKAQGQRQAHERVFRIDTHQPHQAQGLKVRADQDVLAVVERDRNSIGQSAIQASGPSPQGA